jgi:uncharacterized delta-60 repeat protein
VLWVALLLVLAPAVPAAAADGDLDPSFSGDGTAISRAGTLANAIAIQSDGKIVEVGTDIGLDSDYSFVVTRTNADGTPDTTFAGGDGSTQIDFDGPPSSLDMANDVAIAPDGKIVVVGVGPTTTSISHAFGVARLLSNGALDPSFDGDGKATPNCYPDSPSATGCDGIEGATGVVVQSDRKILVGGMRRASSGGAQLQSILLRLNENGSLDSGFDGDGLGEIAVTGGFGEAVGLQPADGKILSATTPVDDLNIDLRDFIIERHDTDGGVDSSFGGGDGAAVADFNGHEDGAFDVAVQSGGKIVEVGYADDPSDDHRQFAIARFNPDGTLDTNGDADPATSFSTDGKQTVDFGSAGAVAAGVAIDPGTSAADPADDKIVVAGYVGNVLGPQPRTGLVRLNSDGTLDTSFAADGKLTSGEEPGCVDLGAQDVALDADRRIVVGGPAEAGGANTAFGLARYGTDAPLTGAPDCDPPDTSVVSGPSGTTADSTPTFGFASTEAGSTFRCAVDGGAFGPCSGPGQTHTPGQLADGPHTFRAVATDAHANADPSPATRSFTVRTPATGGGGGGGGGGGLIVGGCLNTDGGASGRSLGPARLGRKQKSQRGIFKGATLKSRRGLDRYCAVGGGSFRIGYPTKKLLRSAKKRLAKKLKGRVVLILTSSKRFSVKGKRPGSKAKGLKGKHLKIGRNTWYYAKGKLIVVRKKKVVSVGIGDTRLLKTKKLTKKYLTAWKLGT